MKSAKFFIKSNYIKNTKNDWILCFGKLLYHQNITFLHLKSENFDRNPATGVDSASESDSNFNGFATLSQLYQSKISNQQRINVLCNLCQFKSCEIKSVRFENVFKFAIKLVPAGFLRSKKLYLLPDLEDSLTEWCGLITGFISKTNINPPLCDYNLDNKSAMSISSTLRSSRMTQLSPQPSNYQDVYISLDDNDAYESTSHDEFHLVTVEMTTDSLKLNMRGNYIMKLGNDMLELLDVNTRESIHRFPFASIRRFGAKDNLFKLEAGRHCTTGMGHFIFKVRDAICIAETLKNCTRQIKASQSTLSNSCMTINKPSTSQISLQIEPKVYATLKASNRQSMEVISQNSLRSPNRISTPKRTSFRGNFIPKDPNKYFYNHETEKTNFHTNVIPKRASTTELPSELTARLRSRSSSISKHDTSFRLSDRNLFMKETNIDHVSLPTSENKINLSTDNVLERKPSLAKTERPFIFNFSPEMTSRYKDQSKLEPRPEMCLVSSNPVSVTNDIVSSDKFTFNTDMKVDVPEHVKEVIDSTEEVKETEINCDKEIAFHSTGKDVFDELKETSLLDSTEVTDKKAESSESEGFVLPSNPNEILDEKLFIEDESELPVNNRNSFQSDVPNLKSDESNNSFTIPDREPPRPSSLFDNSTSQISSSSTSVSTDSPSFNSLPFPVRTTTAGYRVSESTFFKYRRLPKPPVRTTPPLNYNTRATSFSHSQTVSPTVNRSESIGSPKRSPPPILPKPKFKSPQDSKDEMSFREFDQMLKNLNLSYC